MKGKNKKIFNLFLLGMLFFSGFFFVLARPVKAQWVNHVVISEVQISGNTADDEFIELYNPTDNPIDLTGYFLKKKFKNTKGEIIEETFVINTYFVNKIIQPRKFLLLARKDYYQGLVVPDITWPKSYYLSNNNTIILYDASANIIDKLGWGPEAPDSETQPFPQNPGKNQSIERKASQYSTAITLGSGGQEEKSGNGWDTNNNAMDFVLQTTPNPQNSFSPTENELPLSKPVQQEQQLEQQDQQQEEYKTQNFPSDVVINEFVSDPVDGEEEWIELYNNTDQEIDLTNWKIEEGSGAQTNLSGKIGPKDFFVVEKIKGYLNNTGDIIKLIDSNGRIIDQVSYGNWDDFNKDDNAPTTSDPNSIARIIDGYDTDQDNLDFKISTIPSKGKPNKFLKEYPLGIIINEILPNPKGDDSENEFIELKNITDYEIDLDGWKLEDKGGTKFVISSKNFPTTKILAKGFFVIKRKDSKIALNNSGLETIKLYQPNDNLVDEVSYSGDIAEDLSYARDEKNDWFWTIQPTPGQENIIKKANQKPKAVISSLNKALVNEEIIFDASDSYDPDGDSLTYFWDLGDGTKSENILVKHIYKKAGKYNVKLEVKDSFGETDSTSLKIEILKDEKGEKIIYFNPTELKILITEFLPNPEGSDESEWIEIFNANDKEIDLSGWFLDDAEGGSKPYKIKEGTKILPGEYLVFERKETKIALNNNFDSVRLLDPEGNLFYEISYEKSKEGFSYALDENGEWHWTSILTPGNKNIFSEETKSKTKIATEKGKILEIPLSEVRNQDIGDLIKVKGVVSVEPGVLGSQIFYLSGSGIQIYSSKKEFPNLKIGDKVEIVGELAEYKGETRIKVSLKDDIKILENGIPPEPKKVKTGEIDEDLEGSLVVVIGQMIESKTNYFYLDDSSGEIKVYLKSTTGIKKPKMKEGDWLKVIGIVSQYSQEYRILPRYQSDIELIRKITDSIKFQTASNLSQTKSLFEKIDPFSKIEEEKMKYLFLSALTLLIILISLLIKKKKEKLI